MDAPISKSQKRAMDLLGFAPVSTYAEAAAVLEAADYSRDGIPVNMTWRQAAKLSDADLLAGIKLTDDRFVEKIEY